MNKHKKAMKETRVEPRAMLPLTNGEAASAGIAMTAVNVREQEQSLQVTGVHPVVGAIRPGDRLLAMASGHVVTCRGHAVSIDGTQVAQTASDIVGAYFVGGMMVVVATDEILYLMPDGEDWMVMDPADAVPHLQFGATVSTTSADIAPYTFAAPYQQWRAPLSTVDVQSLSDLLRSVWNALHTDAAAAGLHSGPMLVRWAVRLLDGSYLWLSDPVRVGDATLGNADRIAAVVDSNSSGFTGTQATKMSQTHYRIDITVTRGIAARWVPLIAAIDVLATDEATLVNTGRSLDYRCLTRTTGQREYVLEMGLSRRGADAIGLQLSTSPWRLVATAPAATALSGNDFAAPVMPRTWTAAQCASMALPLQPRHVVCATQAAGRLYCCTSGGDVVVSAPGNPLVESSRRTVVGVVPMAMSVVTRPLYSGGFGRYPVYIFTDDGIYAIPQSVTGRLGEARLVDRTVIAAGVPPVEAGPDVWLISRHGHLCRLSGSRLTVCQRGTDYCALAWCDAYSELWMLPQHGEPIVMLPSGHLCRRTVDVMQLYSDPRHAVVVTSTGQLLDLEQEQASVMPVEWHSHPVALHPLMGQPVHRVVWHLAGKNVDLSLTVTGQRGVMAGDLAVSQMTVDGDVEQPLAAPTMAVRARTLRLHLSGTAATGTLILPALIYSR